MLLRFVFGLLLLSTVAQGSGTEGLSDTGQNSTRGKLPAIQVNDQLVPIFLINSGHFVHAADVYQLNYRFDVFHGPSAKPTPRFRQPDPRPMAELVTLHWLTPEEHLAAAKESSAVDLGRLGMTAKRIVVPRAVQRDRETLLRHLAAEVSLWPTKYYFTDNANDLPRQFPGLATARNCATRLGRLLSWPFYRYGYQQ